MTTTVVVTAVQAIQKTPERNCISTRSGIVGSLVGVVIPKKIKESFASKDLHLEIGISIVFSKKSFLILSFFHA